MLEDKSTRVYVAPEPVLGIAASAADDREWRLRRTARTAMGFAAAGAVGSAVMLTALLVEVSRKSAHGNVEVFLGLLLFLAPLSTLIGLILGIVSRKHRTGKAAIAVSLIPVGLVVVFFLVAVVMGIVAGIRKA